MFPVMSTFIALPERRAIYPYGTTGPGALMLSDHFHPRLAPRGSIKAEMRDLLVDRLRDEQTKSAWAPAASNRIDSV
jgi:hypothetical protein